MKKIVFAFGFFLSIPLLALAYSDVSDSYPYKAAVDSISEKGIVSGYADGTFKPEAKINRAEFTKIVVGAALSYNSSQDPSGYDIYSNQGLSFSDMGPKAWYIPYLRKAVENNVISGYPDGTFKPAQTINLVEASKILANAFKIETIQPQGSEWYSQYIETLASENTIPSSFKYLSQNVTRGEMAEMVWRILEKKSDQPAATLAQLQNPCYPLGDEVPATVDMARVRAIWLKWYNDARAEQGLSPYVYNDQLSRTANIWSEACKARGYMDHRRSPGDAYYDYSKITAWFKDLGLVFKNVNRVTHTENIGWGMYRCSKSDCTDDLISAIRSTFDFFMAEKGTASHAHYDSVMNAYFKEIGLGIAIDQSAGKYYLTVHYGTEIISNPWPICAD
jgi:hypothetical protein